MDKTIKALIVEDVLLIQRLIERFMVSHADCITVADGKMALDLFTSHYFNGDPFNLVCLDIYLPKVNGLAVLENIRNFENEIRLSEEEKSKVIMISSLSNQNMIKKAKTLGCNGYITKPFSKEDVVEELTRLGLIKRIIQSSPGDTNKS